MSSNIDITKPSDKNSSTKDIRNNFSIAKTEIEELQTSVVNLQNSSLGVGYEPIINNQNLMYIKLDADSDISHPELLITFNCDEVSAIERFNNYLSRADVIKTLSTGNNLSGDIFNFIMTDKLLNVWFTLADNSSFNQSIDNTLNINKLIEATWLSSLNLKRCVLTLSPPYKGSGNNNRYRDLIVIGYQGN